MGGVVFAFPCCFTDLECRVTVSACRFDALAPKSWEVFLRACSVRPMSVFGFQPQF